MDQESSPDLRSLLQTLHEVTQLDVACFDRGGRLVAQIAQHAVPAPLGFTPRDRDRLTELLLGGPEPRAATASTAGNLEYVVWSVRGNEPAEGLLFAGPFLTVPPTGELINRLLSDRGMALADRAGVANLLSALPVVGSHYAFALANLGGPMLAAPAASVVAFQSGPLPPKTVGRREPTMLDQKTIEKRYRFEEAVSQAVAHGNLEEYRKVMAKDPTVFHLDDRVRNNPLRSAKNLAFVFNSIMRFAARTGGLHPVYLHQLSERFAIAIEAVKTASEVAALQDEMVEVYIDAVNRFRHPGLTPVTRKVVDHIGLHLHEDLSTATLSARFGLSATHLANRFRRELGTSPTAYVNARRIDEAQRLLTGSDLSVKEIAALAGFSDENYFSRVFRVTQGLTPTAYRNQRNRS